MDVRCERCRAQYVFDDDQVTPSGLTVQCTNCGHVFKVKVKELVVTVPVKPGEGDEAPIPATAAAPRAPASPPEGAPPSASPATGAAAPAPAPPAAVPAAAPASGPSAPSFLPRPDEKGKEWRVRQSNGNVFTFKELTTLQKWIVEQKVARDDEISLSGDQWKRLGNIAELASFFQVVEAAESAKHAAAPAVTPIPMPSVSVYPVVQAPPGYPGGYPQGYPPAFTPPPYPPPPSFAAPPPPAQPQPPAPAPRPAAPAQRSARPVGRAVEVKLDEADLKAVQTGGAWKVVLLVVLLAAGGVGGAWAWRPELFAGLLGGGKPETPPAAEVPLTFEVKPPVTAPAPGTEPPPAPGAGEAAPQGEAGGAEGGPQGDQSPLPAPVQVGDAPLPKAPEPVAKPEPEKPAQPPPPVAKSPKQLMAEADRLRARGGVEKAVDLYERVIATQPGNARALAGRGLCYLDLQQYALAEQSFRSALQADPGEEDALLGLAEAARYQGRRSEAIQHYERYLALHPDGEDAVAARNAINQLKE